MEKFNSEKYFKDTFAETSDKFNFIKKNIVKRELKNDEILNQDFSGVPNIILKISGLSDLKTAEMLINKNTDIIETEYGEISQTADLQKYDICQIAKIIKDFSQNKGIKFLYSTPKILSERDFERVYEDIKNIFSKTKPDALVINNKKFLKKASDDNFWTDKNIEIGKNISLRVAEQVINNGLKISGIEFSENFENIQNFLKNFDIKNRKFTIFEKKEIYVADFCPLNTAGFGKSGLYCKAPCSKNNYAFKNPETEEIIPFMTDGFCNTHFYNNNNYNIYNYNELMQKGINRFIVDLSKK